MDKALVAQGVANKLFAAENSVDASMTQTAMLLAGLIEARQEMKLAATVGDDVIAKVSEALAAMTTARTAMVTAHNELADLKLRVGVRTKMFGTFEKDARFEDSVVAERRAS